MFGKKKKPIKKSLVNKNPDHETMIDYMENSLSLQTRPQLGIFWYDPKEDELIFVNKVFAHQVGFRWGGQKTIDAMHIAVWQSEKNKAKSKAKVWKYSRDSSDTPRGRVWEIKNKGFVVTIGSWLDDYPHVKDLILKEFNLPKNTEFRYDYHWDVGHGFNER
jgi:hypothetical protein